MNKSPEVSKNTFGFPSLSIPPKNQLIYEFENYMYNLIKNIEFKKVNNIFPTKINCDLREIKNSGKIFVKADKTKNIYGIKPHEYEKLITENITKNYKKCNPDKVNKVNEEASRIAKKLDIDDQVQVIAGNSAFVTIKDHKPNFPNKIHCRLLNPSKSEIGKVSKEYVDKINNSIRNSSLYN